jgi:hypothetical protein
MGHCSSMPFRDYPTLDLDTVRVMTEAYDSVVERLHLKPEDPRRGRLATLIVQLAKAGVVDPHILADQARAGLRK